MNSEANLRTKTNLRPGIACGAASFVQVAAQDIVFAGRRKFTKVGPHETRSTQRTAKQARKCPCKRKRLASMILRRMFRRRVDCCLFAVCFSVGVETRLLELSRESQYSNKAPLVSAVMRRCCSGGARTAIATKQRVLYAVATCGQPCKQAKRSREQLFVATLFLFFFGS